MLRSSKPSRMAGCLFALLAGTVPAGVLAQEPEAPQAEVIVNGEWQVVYGDQEIGLVEGVGTIDEQAGTARVIYTHPRTGRTFSMASSTFNRTGDKITIAFDRAQPGAVRDDGKDYPQRHIVVPEETREVRVRVGADTAKTALAPRKDSDADRIKLELSIEDQSTLSGTWSYRADPFTQRDRTGFGRVGDFAKQEDGTGLQTGPETWIRPPPIVLGAIVLEDQVRSVRYLGDPGYPHPFQDDKFKGKGTHRTIFVFGLNLPDGRNSKAVIEPGGDSVVYGRVIYPDSTFKHIGGFDDPFGAGKAMLRELLSPEAPDAVKSLDYLVVGATLEKGVLPGLQPFTVNGSEMTWLLRFGNNRADVRFIRQIDPGRASSKGRDFERTFDAFIPEEVRVEVRTELELDIDVIHVTIGRNGQPQKLGGSPLVPARRTAVDSHLYRTAPIMLTKSVGTPQTITSYGETPLRPIEPAPGLLPGLAQQLVEFAGGPLTVQHDDKLLANIAEPGLISVMPPPGRLKVYTSPAKIPHNYERRVGTALSSGVLSAPSKTLLPRQPYSYLWKDNLRRAATCYPEIDITDWDQANYDFADDIKRNLNFAWWKVLVPATLLLPEDVLNVDFLLGDHTALLMMRQAFVQMMNERLDEFAYITFSEDRLRAFWLMMDPSRWNPAVHPLTDVDFDIQVTGPDGAKISFMDTYRTQDDEPRKIQHPDKILPWIVSATREAIKEYMRILEQSLVKAELIDTCDLEKLVKLTGASFEPIQEWLFPRLMRLEENIEGAGKTMTWAPDYTGRLMVDDVVNKYWRVKKYGEIADADTQHVVMALAIVTLPVMMVGGTTVAVIVGLSEIALEAAVKYPKYAESAAEIEFARGTVDILGYGRHMQAKADEYSIYDYGFDIAVVAAAELVGGHAFNYAVKVIAAPIRAGIWVGRTSLKLSSTALKRMLLSFRKGIRYVRARRGNRLFEKFGFDVSMVPSDLRARDYRDMMEYIFEAGRLRAAKGVLDDHQIEIIRRLEELAEEVKSRPKWADSLDSAAHNDLKDLYFRGDIKELVESAGGAVARALRTTGRMRDEALRILRYSARRTGEQFQAALDARLKLKTEPQGQEFWDMTAIGNRDVSKRLTKNGWFINFPNAEDGADLIKIRDPAGNVDQLKRAFEPASGTLKLQHAYRNNIASHISADLPIALSEKGVPAFLFAQLRYLNKVGIGYAGMDGDLLKKVLMENIVNVRTAAQLAWFRKTYHPGKTFKELIETGVMGEFLKDTRSVQYARSVITMAGYRVRNVRLILYEGMREMPIKSLKFFYKKGSDGEVWEQFLKRLGVTEDTLGPPGFDIEIEVEPDPNALRKMAAKDDLRAPKRSPGEVASPTTGSSEGPPGGEPPNGPKAVSSSADDPEYFEVLERLRRAAEEKAEDAAQRYRRALEDDTEITDEAAKRIFEAAYEKNFQDALEAAVKGARRTGVPDEVIENYVRNFAQFESFEKRIKQLRAIEKASLERQGHIVLGPGDADDALTAVGNVRAGNPTPEDLAFLRRKIAAAAAEGRDYLDDLARTGTMSDDTPFELVADADEIARLRNLVRRENLTAPAAEGPPDVPSTRPTEPASIGGGDSPTDSDLLRSPNDIFEGPTAVLNEHGEVVGRTELGFDEPTWVLDPKGRILGRTEIGFDEPTYIMNETGEIIGTTASRDTGRFSMELPPSALEEMGTRLRALDPLEKKEILKTANMMARLGVPEESVLDLVTREAIRLTLSGGIPILTKRAELVAEGILVSGTRRVSHEEIGRVTGLPGAMVEIAAKAAAMRRSLAAMPGAVLPAYLYPPLDGFF